MKKRVLALLVLLTTLICICSCSRADSTFSIQFIDVGQGDSALVECDGRYMLIDGGKSEQGNKVYRVLEDKGIRKLDILVATHHHEDHIGGFENALKNISRIKLTLSNSIYSDSEWFKDFEDVVRSCKSKIKVPAVGEKYSLGSAIVEVVDVSSTENNDSLVILVTYGDTRFLFTGDIEGNAQERIADKYRIDNDEPFEIDLMKMPHHGGCSKKNYDKMYIFLRTFMPQNVVISVGKNNQYGHPDSEILVKLQQLEWKGKKTKIYRTDDNGHIFVKSNGEEITIETSK